MSTSSVLVDISMLLNLEQLMFEQDDSDAKDSKVVYTMWCEHKNVASEVKHTES